MPSRVLYALVVNHCYAVCFQVVNCHMSVRIVSAVLYWSTWNKGNTPPNLDSTTTMHIVRGEDINSLICYVAIFIHKTYMIITKVHYTHPTAVQLRTEARRYHPHLPVVGVSSHVAVPCLARKGAIQG
jgi:hypothetical protein